LSVSHPKAPGFAGGYLLIVWIGGCGGIGDGLHHIRSEILLMREGLPLGKAPISRQWAGFYVCSNARFCALAQPTTSAEDRFLALPARS
jgi:hypothetical protein